MRTKNNYFRYYMKSMPHRLLVGLNIPKNTAKDGSLLLNL